MRKAGSWVENVSHQSGWLLSFSLSALWMILRQATWFRLYQFPKSSSLSNRNIPEMQVNIDTIDIRSWDLGLMETGIIERIPIIISSRTLSTYFWEELPHISCRSTRWIMWNLWSTWNAPNWTARTDMTKRDIVITSSLAASLISWSVSHAPDIFRRKGLIFMISSRKPGSRTLIWSGFWE